VGAKPKFRHLSIGRVGKVPVRIAVMALAVGVFLFALFPLLAGGWIVSQRGAVSTALLGFGVVMFLGAAAAAGATLCLLVRLGRPQKLLWAGSMGSLLSGAALSMAAFTHIFPCSGPD
jgi:hypothetical protein